MSDSISPQRTGSSVSGPSCPTLAHLEAEAKAGRIVVRVYSQSSACRLNWTGEAEMSGFSSLNGHLAGLSPIAYANALTSTRPYRALSDPKRAADLPRRPVAASSRLPPRPAPSTPNLPPHLALSTLTRSDESATLVDVTGPTGHLPPPPAHLPSRPRRPLPRPPRSAPSPGTAASPTPTRALVSPVVRVPSPEPPRTPTPPNPTRTTPSAPWSNWTDGYHVRQTIIDHTNKRIQASFDVPWDEPQVGADGLSPWISASYDPAWAVWEVARRLAQVPTESVHIAVIAMEPNTQLATARGASGEVVLDPYPILIDVRRKNIGTATQGRMTNNEKESVERSLFSVNASKEVLFYGRVFADSIVSVLEFTAEHLPLELPRHWFAGRGATWLDSLVWDPYELGYDWYNARQRIKVAASGGELSSLSTLRASTLLAPPGSSAHTGQTGDRETPTVPTAPAAPSSQLTGQSHGQPRPMPANRPGAIPPRPRLRDTPPRLPLSSKQYSITEQTKRMARGISDNGWGRVAMP